MLLRLAGGAVLPSLAWSGCERPPAEGERPRELHLVPVDLDPGRVLSSYVCARPFRPSGFRVELERLGGSVLVHNYGHGGGGFTLSWGTAEMAAELLREAGAAAGAEVAVVGCGVVGLTTALVLLERGFSVSIFARELPPATTSNLAGASFFPSSAVDLSLLTPERARRLERACRISHARFTAFVGDVRYRVSWKPQYFVTDEWSDEIAAGDAVYQLIRDLYPNPRLLSDGEHPFRARYAFREDNLFIEPTPYLAQLVDDVRARGGTIERRAFDDLDGIRGLAEQWVVNCAGLGAASLVADDELTPSASQTVILEPQPGVDYAVTSIDGAYMFPRSDGIMLGRGEGIADPQIILDQQARLVPRAS